MTAPEQTPENELEVKELADENLEEVSGGGNVFGQLATDSCTATYDVWLAGDKPDPSIF